MKSQCVILSSLEVLLAPRRNEQNESFIENGGREQIILKLFVLLLPSMTINRGQELQPLFIPSMTRTLSGTTSSLKSSSMIYNAEKVALSPDKHTEGH